MEKAGDYYPVLRRAYALAGLLGHSSVGTSHLLVALAMDRGRPWARQSLSAQELLACLIRIRGRGIPTEKLPAGLTPGAKEVLSRKEPLPLSLLRAEKGGAWELLNRCGADRDLLFTDYMEDSLLRKEKVMQSTRLLDQFGVDLVEQADMDRPIIGRQREIETVLQILSRKHKNNPALIGEPGVGKTAIVEGVAQYIAAGHVPEQLRGKRLISLDMASVLAGTKYRGEFEERIRDILNEIRRVRNVILFIDEMHTLVGAGAAEGAIDAANLLKPALGRGEIQMIGATTLKEYRKFIEKDGALERRFRCVQVREPTKGETAEILRGLRAGLEAHHGIPITEEAILAAVELSCRYLSDKFLPDKAVDLLDEGAALAGLRGTGGGVAGKALTHATDTGDYSRAAALRQRLRLGSTNSNGVRQEDVAAAVADRTGIPVGVLSLTEKERLRNLEQLLGKRVVGQEDALHRVCEAVRRGRSGLAEEKRPVATLLFTGPTGVGKTELCKALAEGVYGSEKAMIRVDMSEYMEKFSLSRLTGAPPGYVGHEEGSEFCEQVRRRPYSLILLDELEKAHRDVCGILLQIMEDGVLTDSLGRKVDFRNTLLVMTSNLGSDRGNRGALGFGSNLEEPSLRALRERFPPEFLGRIDCIANFRPLEKEDLSRITALELEKLAKRAEKQGITLRSTPSLYSGIAERVLHRPGGAREIRRLIQREIEAPLAELLLERQPPKAVEVSAVSNTIALRQIG